MRFEISREQRIPKKEKCKIPTSQNQLTIKKFKKKKNTSKINVTKKYTITEEQSQ